MRLYINPDRSIWPLLCVRPMLHLADIEERVRAILSDVKARGDAALFDFARKFDNAHLTALRVGEEELAYADTLTPDVLKTAIRNAIQNVRHFHEAQMRAPEIIETQPGIRCWRKAVAIDRVGFYIPGGTAPLFSTVIMLGVPSLLAGCRQRILCTPPASDGTIHPAILFTARELNIDSIFKVGGAQAIAAMSVGTESVPGVDKIFGPGNQYVTLAKQFVQQSGVAIDMPAGPSELAVIADEHCVPEFVAADLLSQAEHGRDSQVVLIATSERIVEEVRAAMTTQRQSLPREAIALEALENSRALVFDNLDTGLEFANVYAAEHLIIACAHPEYIAEKVINAGSVFLGNYSPESVGDYASGTNHTLPTNGFARAYSGVSVDSFVKHITFQHLSPEGLRAIAATVETMAEHEGLQAHKQAVEVRRLRIERSV